MNKQYHLNVSDEIINQSGPLSISTKHLRDINKFIDWKSIYEICSYDYEKDHKQIQWIIRGLFLQYIFQFSDSQFEEQLNDRLSFRQFVGLSLNQTVDFNTFWKYRDNLTNRGLLKDLFAEFNCQLEAKGLVSQNQDFGLFKKIKKVISFFKKIYINAHRDVKEYLLQIEYIRRRIYLKKSKIIYGKILKIGRDFYDNGRQNNDIEFMREISLLILNYDKRSYSYLLSFLKIKKDNLMKSLILRDKEILKYYDVYYRALDFAISDLEIYTKHFKIND